MRGLQRSHHRSTSAKTQKSLAVPHGDTDFSAGFSAMTIPSNGKMPTAATGGDARRCWEATPGGAVDVCCAGLTWG